MLTSEQIAQERNLANGIKALQAENEQLRGHCIALAGHLRWASKVIAAFGKTAQLEAIDGAIQRWEAHP